jgi:hypothetical protein
MQQANESLCIGSKREGPVSVKPTLISCYVNLRGSLESQCPWMLRGDKHIIAVCSRAVRTLLIRWIAFLNRTLVQGREETPLV